MFVRDANRTKKRVKNMLYVGCFYFILFSLTLLFLTMYVLQKDVSENT